MNWTEMNWTDSSMDIRKEVLFSMLAFVADTKRFIEKKDVSTFYVL